MNRFIKKTLLQILLFCLFLLIIIGYAVYLNYNHKEDYPAAIINKYKRLDSLKSTSKIIICGGSSSCYSINSFNLQKQLEKPVINTSLAMSLGSKFHLNLTKDYITKGDVILYIPEYEFYFGNELGDDFLYTTAFYYPLIFKDFTNEQKRIMFKKVIRLSVEYFSGKVKHLLKPRKESLQYKREAYNYLGDNISLINTEKVKYKPKLSSRYDRLKTTKISKKFTAFLKEFNAFCKLKGAKLIVSFPPIEVSQYDKRFKNAIKILQAETGLEFIGNSDTFVYETALFYDSSYHLNGKGRKIRSTMLINELKKELN